MPEHESPWDNPDHSIEKCSNDPEENSRRSIMTAEAIQKLANTTRKVSMTGHGFVPGTIIYYNGATYIKAVSTSSATTGRFVVSRVVDVNNFVMVASGLAEIDYAPFAALCMAGHYYMTSNATAGTTIDIGNSSADTYTVRNIMYQVISVVDDIVIIDVLPWRSDMNKPPELYTLEYSAGPDGTVGGNLTQSVEAGNSGSTVVANPAAGFSFLQWSDGITQATRTDVNVQASIAVVAAFGQVVTITYAAGAGGVITGDTPQTIAVGANGTAVTAVPNSGYIFTGWSDGNENTVRAETNVTVSVTLTATFAIKRTLTYNDGDHGSVTGVNPQIIPNGTDGTAVEALTNEGWDFTQWSDGVTANPRTDLNVTADITVTAEYTEAINFISGGGGNLHQFGKNIHIYVDSDEQIIMMGQLPYLGAVRFFGDTASHDGPLVVAQPSAMRNPAVGPRIPIKKLMLAGVDLFVLYANGNLYFIGRNSYGISGVSTLGAPVAVMTLVNTDVLDVEASANSNGYYHRSSAMIIKDVAGQRKVFTTGYNAGGGMSNGTTSTIYSWHDATPLGKQVAAIFNNEGYGANGHTAIITTDGEVWTCGDNGVGQLGDGTKIDKLYFVKMAIPSAEVAVQVHISYNVDANSGNTFVLTQSGNIYGCGRDGLHRFATGVAGDKVTPFKMYDGSTTKAVFIVGNTIGATMFLYLDELGNVYGVGSNAYGQLGDTSGTHRNLWVNVALPTDGASQRVASISLIQERTNSSYTTALVTTTDNRILTWGFNNYGQCGDGTTVTRKTPVDITGPVSLMINIADISSIWACGDDYDRLWYIQTKFSASNKYGAVYGFGDNRHRILSNATVANYKTIMQVYNA